MTTTPFDTLAYAKKLKAAGIPDMQAEAQAEALASAISGELPTKADLHGMELKLEGKISILQWMIGFNLALTVTVLFKIFL